MTGERVTGQRVTGDVPRHRRVTPAARWWSRALGAGLVLAGLLAGGAVTAHTPDTDRREQPFVRSGAAGAAVDGRTFATTLLGVRGGATLRGGGRTHDTSGIWVLVRVRLAARTDPISIGYAALVDAGDRVYFATGRVTQPLAGGRLLQPGIPVVGEIAFEVPLAAAGTVRLRLSAPQLDQRMDAVTECRLPVDGATVRRWRAQTQPLVLADPELAP